MRWRLFGRKKQSESEASSPFVIMGGRRIKVDSPYMFPKDLGETNRLDLQHYMLKYVLKGNYLAPIRNPQSILDVGCGTGRWGAEMARQFAAANVVGVDIAPPSANSASVTQGQEQPPENYVFVEGDVTKGLPFADSSFDFVHMRLVVLALPYAQWMPVITELQRVTKPGGWIELVDTAVTARTPGGQRWIEWAHTLARYRGIDMTAGGQIGAFLERAGMRNVKTLALEIPLGKWGGRIGTLMATDAIAGAKALESPVVLQAKLATQQEFQQTIDTMMNEYNTLVGPTQPFYIAYGQR